MKINTLDENDIIESLYKLHYLIGIFAGSANTLPYHDYQTCIRYCNSLINLFKGMLEVIEEEEGD